MASRSDIFTTIQTEGALLPPDLLQRITEGSDDLEGLRPADYFLLPGERLNESISHAWSRLQGVWLSFQNDRARLPSDDPGTTLTRNKWLQPLFTVLEYGQLDFVSSLDVDDRSYPISHRSPDGRVPLHLVGCNVPLDRRTPGVQGAATASPHSTLQVFLNRSGDHLWGIVSNGLRLRLLRDNVSLTRQAFIEFDLEAMMEGEVYADFVLLYLLLHKSRFAADRPAEFWIEQWRQVAIEQGTRALDQLRDQVQVAIECLGAGFLDHPANARLRERLASGALDKQDYYRQLLRLVYRLLFLFTAEDRGLLVDPAQPEAAHAVYLENYSTRRLRTLAENFRGTRHHDAYEGLRLVMRLLGGEGPHPPAPSPSGRRGERGDATSTVSGREGGAGDTPSTSSGRRGETGESEGAVEKFREMASQAMVEAARELRQRETPVEEVLWACLRNRRLGGIKFRRQHPVAQTRYVADFFSYEANLIVELDGPVHKGQAADDARRQADLEALGYTVLRFTNDDVADNLQSVLATILHYSPLPEGEGGNRRLLGVRANPEGEGGNRRLLGVRAPAALLGLPVLDGFLFRDDAVADIIDASIANRDLLDAVRALAFIEDKEVRALRPVDYRNLGPEELGSVYESLLELHPELNVDARTFSLSTAAGHERKTTGSYYTPDSLVQELLKSALEPVLEEAKNAEDPEQAILNLKVCDPATGSGHFLVAAAHRIARALAQVRTHEEEPPPDAMTAALRHVIGHCIYGVDINPMAVELCKVSLWMEALEPGKPLTFLDHRIKVGNSLLGTTPKLMAGGIPVEAFPTKSGLLEGDDAGIVSALRKKNRDELNQLQNPDGGVQMTLFDTVRLASGHDRLANSVRAIEAAPDDTPAGVQAQANAYRALQESYAYQRHKFLADLWCAAFVWRKTAENVLPPTSLVYNRLVQAENIWAFPGVDAMAEEVEYLTERYQFFHWHIEFPDVFDVPDDLESAENEQTGWNGGFDCVLGNPPWERIKIEAKEWFAEVVPEIADAPRKSVRTNMIQSLKKTNPRIYHSFISDKRKAEGESHFTHNSGRYPLTGRGDVNTYQLFAGLCRELMSSKGRAGVILPSGIATDSTTQYFFQDLIQSQQLASLFDFENREAIFSAIHRSYKFSLLTLSRRPTTESQFVFFALKLAELYDQDKRFALTVDDIALINPNTRTSPIFRTKRDADLTTDIYRRVPVLLQEDPFINPWGISFSTPFHMSNDSHLFYTREQLSGHRIMRDANRHVSVHLEYLPLYEAKMFHQFDHRWATYVETDVIEDVSGIQKTKPTFIALPRYWIDFVEAQRRLRSSHIETRWYIAFRNGARSTDVRTAIASILPISGLGHTASVLTSQSESTTSEVALFANFNSFVFDYCVRQKIGGIYMGYFMLKQLPVLPPLSYSLGILDFIVPRVLELTYTAWDLQPFARDVGWDGPPFVWDEERRFLMRCELDALYFHLYGIERDDVDYIMETFPIVKRKDEQAHGHYRTKDTILAMYDEMAALPKVAVPSPLPLLPEGEGDRGRGSGGEGEYLVPDVSQSETWLSPGPADPSVAHEEKE